MTNDGAVSVVHYAQTVQCPYCHRVTAVKGGVNICQHCGEAFSVRFTVGPKETKSCYTRKIVLQ